ncbi:hypothetical protein ACWC10_01145 [Streptomyces sp. NPDC001595]|uniref:hypothetical protein n=1 Tax=Streptomyces sp. NPDC001532 TaxID=3154520 RepID=UPI0033285ED1
MSVTHLYKKRLGPWGLVARVTLEAGPVDEPPREARFIGDSRVRLLPPPGITPAETRWMDFGLGLVAGQLEALWAGTGPILVRVTGYDVPMLTDYQDEVAAAALVECLREHYGLTGVEIGLTFDGEHNRYDFTWG